MAGTERPIRMAMLGMGNQGCKYAEIITEQLKGRMEIAAVTRIRPADQERMKRLLPSDIPVYASVEELLDAVEKGVLEVDAALIATPHIAHERQTVAALRLGLHVLCDKPAGASCAQARRMNEEAARHALVYAMIFNQRTNPIYQRLRQIVAEGTYGALKRVEWVVTDWYRPNCYYQSGSWRGSWERDGGGLLLNQCPHNLDLLQWICGMPLRVQAFCHEGKYHDIEVEDEVTAYLEFEGGATGVFISSTGEAPGINRLEIALEDARLVCENGTLHVCELGFHEPDYRRSATESFPKLEGTWHELVCEGENTQHAGILSDFADAVQNGTPLLAAGEEGIRSLRISNAMYLSAWQRRMVELPQEGTDEERVFEEEFERAWRQKWR